MKALSFRNLFVLTLLLACLGRDAQAGTHEMRRALMQGDVEKVRKLLDGGAPATGAGLIRASDPHAVDLMKLLLDHGMSIKKEEKDNNWIANAGNIGSSLACVAAAAGNDELLKFELAHGAAPDGVYGQRPLHCAVQGQTLFGYKTRIGGPHGADIKAINILLDAGANPAQRDSDGKSFVQTIETDADRAAILQLLSDRKIDISALQ